MCLGVKLPRCALWPLILLCQLHWLEKYLAHSWLGHGGIVLSTTHRPLSIPLWYCLPDIMNQPSLLCTLFLLDIPALEPANHDPKP